MHKTYLSFYFCLFFGILFLFSCQRAEKIQTTQLSLSISQPSSEKNSTLELNPNGTINPTGIADINCYALLISGPEDSLRKNTCKMENGATFPVGFYAGGFYAQSGGTDISLEIPSGKDRVIKLVGFRVDTNSLPANYSAKDVCADFKGNSAYEMYMSDPFLIGELGQLEMLPGANKQLEFQSSFVATQKIADCTGPDFSSGSGSGGGSSTNPNAPVKLGIIFQDGVGTATKPLKADSCVGLKIQLQDQYGNRANVSNLTQAVQAKVKVVTATGIVGSFFKPNPIGTTQCMSTASISLSGDFTLSFQNSNVTSNNYFTDYNLFFSPAANSTSRTLIVEDVNAKLAQGAFTFSYSSETAMATQYAFFDFYNNVSSVSAVATQPQYLMRNECRPGAVQLLDQDMVPMKKLAQAGASTVKVYKPMFQDIEFYNTLSECNSATSGITGYIVKPVISGTVIETLPFYYKIISTNITDISFGIYNNTTTNSPYNLINSGDLTPATNVWQIKN